MTEPAAQPPSAPHTQTEALFDVPEPPIRKGSGDYLGRLAVLNYRYYAEPDGWAFWALAPYETRWKKPAEVEQVEHVWLIQQRHLFRALIDLQTGDILRYQRYGAEP